MARISQIEMEDDAERLFEAFHGRKARANEIVCISPVAGVMALEIGRADAIMYSIEGERKPLFHRFGEKAPNNRPRLFVSFDGSQIYLLRGAYRFTADGFKG